MSSRISSSLLKKISWAFVLYEERQVRTFVFTPAAFAQTITYVELASMLSSSIYCKHSPAHSAQHKGAKHVRTGRSERDNASEQSWPHHAVERTRLYLVYIYISLYSRRERRNRNLPGQIKGTTTYKQQPAGDARNICLLCFQSR